MCDVCLDGGTVFFLLLLVYGVPFGVASMIIAIAGRPWVGLILAPLAFLVVHLAMGQLSYMPTDLKATVLPLLLLTLGLWRFGCVPGTYVLRRWVRIITFAVGVLCLVPLAVLASHRI